MTDQPHTVFVSHAHIDNDLCDRYVAALRSRGLDVWYDRTNMQVGHSLTADIEAELRMRTAFVVIATPASLASQWVRSEIAAFRYLSAHDSARLFVPLRAVECEMPLLWADILSIDAVTLGFEATIEVLSDALRAPEQEAESVSAHAVADPALYQGDADQTVEVGKGFVVNPDANVTPQQVESAAPLPSVETVSTLLPPASVSAMPTPPPQTGGIDDIVKHGQKLLSLGSDTQAQAIFDLALQIDPNSVDAWIGKGDALCHRFGEGYLNVNGLTPPKLFRRYRSSFGSEEALAAYERAVDLDPDNAWAWYSKGEALHNLQRFDEASEAYDRALALDSTKPEIWLAKGDLLSNIFYKYVLPDAGFRDAESQARMKARDEGALAAYEQALDLDPSNLNAWIGKGDALHALHRDREAIEAYDQALALDSTDVEIKVKIWMHKADALGWGYSTEELAAYEEALKLDPANKLAWYRKAIRLGRLNRHAEELAAYEEALKLDPNDRDAWYGKSQALVALGRKKEAAAADRRATELGKRPR